MRTTQDLIDEVVKTNNPKRVLDEYILKRNVHGYTTRTDLSKELGKGLLGSFLKGWVAIEKKSTSVKYMMKTNAGTFLFTCKYAPKGVVVELIWPKVLDAKVLKKFVNVKTPNGSANLMGIPVGNNNYGTSVLFPVEEGGHVKLSTYIKPINKLASGLAKIAKKAKSRFLDVSGTEEPKSKAQDPYGYGLRDLETV